MNDREYKKTFPRIRITLGRPLNKDLEAALSDIHAKLISVGFYSQFRSRVDESCKQLRLYIDSLDRKGISRNLMVSDVVLGFHQKSSLRTLYSLNFKKSIAHHFKTKEKIVFPISNYYRKELSRDSFLEFNHFLCGLLYAVYLFFFFFKSLSKLFKYIFLYENSEELELRKRNYAQSVFLANLPAECFPLPEVHSHNFIDWINDKLIGEYVIFHNSDQNSNSVSLELGNPLLHSQIFTEFTPRIVRLKLFLRLLRVLLKDLSSKSLWIPLICQLDELYVSLLLEMNPEVRALKSVYFTNTVSVQRPLWSLSLERMGVNVILIHYSASAEPSESFGTPLKDGIWHLSSWTHAWVIDQAQSEFAIRLSPKYAKHFKVVGVPLWAGKKFDFVSSNHKLIISVFDTYIRANNVFSAGIIDDFGWNNIDLEWDFIFGILQATEGRSIKVLHKRKRPIIDLNAEIRENNRIRLLNLFGNRYQEVEEDFSPESLIDYSQLVISKPISTVSFIAKQRGCDAIFFDPTGNLNKSDPALRGLFLASNSEEIKEYIANNLINYQSRK